MDWRDPRIVAPAVVYFSAARGFDPLGHSLKQERPNFVPVRGDLRSPF
jgi:hypothetical protein